MTAPDLDAQRAARLLAVADNKTRLRRRRTATGWAVLGTGLVAFAAAFAAAAHTGVALALG